MWCERKGNPLQLLYVSDRVDRPGGQKCVSLGGQIGWTDRVDRSGVQIWVYRFWCM